MKVSNYASIIQKSGINYNSISQSEELTESTIKVDTGKGTIYDTIELSEEGLKASREIKVTIPRAWTIGDEAFKADSNNIKEIVAKAHSMNLSFGEHEKFIKNERKKWLADVKDEDPEMFAYLLKMRKKEIESGKPELASLPSDFTMDDYHKYVKPFENSWLS